MPGEKYWIFDLPDGFADIHRPGDTEYCIVIKTISGIKSPTKLFTFWHAKNYNELFLDYLQIYSLF